jgi:hypothetical protein
LQAEVPSHTPAATLVSDMRRVRLHCHDAGSHLAIDRLLGPLRRYAGDRRVLSNEEVEVAVREWLQMQWTDFNGDDMFELALRWDKCVAVLRDCAEK